MCCVWGGEGRGGEEDWEKRERLKGQTVGRCERVPDGERIYGDNKNNNGAATTDRGDHPQASCLPRNSRLGDAGGDALLVEDADGPNHGEVP